MAEQDPNLEEGADNPERPEWLPENFDSPEALAASYKEAQRKITELSQSNRGLEESIQSLSTQFEEFTASQNRPDPNAVYSQWQDLYDQDPIGTIAQIAQATASQVLAQQSQGRENDNLPSIVAALADQQLSRQFEDWDEYKPKVAELLANDPVYGRDDLYSSPETAARTLTTAYNVAKAQDILNGATDLASQQAADTRAMKLNAQTAVGASGRPSTPADQQAEWDAIKAARPKNYWE